VRGLRVELLVVHRYHHKVHRRRQSALQIPGASRYREVLERWGKEASANQVTAKDACAGIQEELNQITERDLPQGSDPRAKNYVDTLLKEKGLYP
jgi:hypothetical protein